MGFQQQVLDQLFIAFLSAFGALLVSLPANFIGLEHPTLGLVINCVGCAILFRVVYRFYFIKKFQIIPSPIVYFWWTVLAFVFSFALSSPIILRESWITPDWDFLFLFLPLLGFIGFEIYNYHLALRRWFFSEQQ